MSVISDVSICNSALAKVGADRILTLSDETAQGRLCKEQYEKIRDSLLMEHPWNFAVARKTLALTTYKPSYEYENAFQIPADCLRVIDTDLNQGTIGEVHYDVEVDPDTENKYLVTNESTVALKYIRRVSEARFTPLFAEVLATRLAKEFAYALTQSASLAKMLSDEYKKILGEARSYDAMESSIKTVGADDWLFSRF